MEWVFRNQEVCAMVFASIWVAVWIFVRILQLLAILYGKWILHKCNKNTLIRAESSFPGVSILKPLTNMDKNDANLFSNLETFFTLEYPGNFEIIFCIQDLEDVTLQSHINKLCSTYPKIDTRVCYGGKDVGINPKINNLLPGYSASKYELIMISDSRIRLKNDTLTDMVSHMTEKVGLVHQMPFTYGDNDTLGNPIKLLEKIHFGTSFARMYLVANCLGMNCAVGMSSIIRKSIIDGVGGLEVFGKYLAEDFFMGQAVLDSNYQVRMSSHPALQNSEQCSITSFHSRITRWTKLRMAMVPLASFCEPFSECLLLGCLATWSVMVLFCWDPLSFFFIHILIWFLMDWILLMIIQNEFDPINKFNFFVIWVYRELTVPYLYLISIIEPDIKWGSKRFRLRFGGTAKLCEEQPTEEKKIWTSDGSILNTINSDDKTLPNVILNCG